MSYATLEMADRIAIVWMDQEGEKVNQLAPEMLEEFKALTDRFEKDDAIEGVVLASRKKDFIAGADVRMILGVTAPGEGAALTREGHALLRRMADSRKPIVAAIHGACLGGGLEVALACQARIASDSPRTHLGLPEVMLGLLPGAGGTQRLPRKVGLSKAVEMMLTGRKIYARPALKMGLVDALTSEGALVGAACQLARELKAGKPAGRKRKKGFVQWLLDDTPIGHRIVFSMARKNALRETRGNYPAPEKILECVQVGYESGIEAGFEAESKNFDELARTPVAKNLIRLFLAMTERKKNPWADQVRPVERVAVLGAGLMGAGIANVTAQKGKSVFLKDIDWDRVAAGIGHIWKDIDKKRRRKVIRPTERDAIASRISGTTDLARFGGVDVVIEAVFEDMDLKRRVLAETEAACRPDAIFATNTSALPIDEIAEASAHPETVIGMHYFSPVEKMPLLEIVEGPRTAEWVKATAYDIGVVQGKTVIVVGDGPGFYTSRILGPYMNEAILLLEEGARIEVIDSALKDYGFPVGPITLFDEVGIDVAAKIMKNMKGFVEARGGKTGQAILKLADAGYAGRKNRKGFYVYRGKGLGDRLKSMVFGRKPIDKRVYKIIGAPPRRDFDRLQIAERMTLAMVNEAALCLQEGLLRNPGDGDVGAILGLGFPPFRGGPFRFIDEMGAGAVVEKLEALREKHGPQFEPARILRDHAASGKPFHEAEV